jgi:hypothetical protein
VLNVGNRGLISMENARFVGKQEPNIASGFPTLEKVNMAQEKQILF